MKRNEWNTSSFEEFYYKVRNKEKRLYTDDKVQLLPYLEKEDFHYKEWMLRAKTLERFLSYLSDLRPKVLLEIGCGNGWFSNHCSQKAERVMGVDLNLLELEQAARVFNKDTLHFYYWDVFAAPPFKEKIDCIVLNAVVQYFPDFKRLISRLKELLTEKGEIHILDSPFYKTQDIDAAKQRSLEYYTKMGVPEMADHYFHHAIGAIEDFDILYQAVRNRIIKQFIKKDSPFPWLRLKP